MTIQPLRLLACLALPVLLESCASPPVQISYFDLGPADSVSGLTTLCTLPALQLAELTTDSTLDDTQMHYRLQYLNPQRDQSYSTSRWTVPPAQMLQGRIKTHLALAQVPLIDHGIANPEGWQLRAEVTDFTQYFSDDRHSTARIGMRFSLVHANRLAAQTVIVRETGADSADAAGGAAALRSASQSVLTDLDSWLCKTIRP